MIFTVISLPGYPNRPFTMLQRKLEYTANIAHVDVKAFNSDSILSTIIYILVSSLNIECTVLK